MKNHVWTHSGCLGVWNMLTYPRTRGRCLIVRLGGVSSWGYRLYDMNRCKVLFSHDVVFDESKPGVEKEPKDDKPREPAEQDMDLDLGSDAESVVGQAEPMDGQTEEMVDQGERVHGRPVRQRRTPDMYGEWVNLSQDHPEPSSVCESMASSNKSKWREAMKKEMKSLYKNEVWDLVEPLKGRKIVGSK